MSTLIYQQLQLKSYVPKVKVKYIIILTTYTVLRSSAILKRRHLVFRVSPPPLPRHVLLTLYVVFLSSLFCKGCFRSQFHFFSLLWSRHVSIYTFLGFVSFLEPGKKANGHVKYNYLFPEAAANRFSILFVIKNGFTGNLIKLFATSDLFSVTHLFRVSLTKSSLSVHNDNGENVSYNLEETFGTWRQLALSVEDDSLILYTSCKETSSRFLKRNLTLWNKVHVVVGEEAHKHNEVASL